MDLAVITVGIELTIELAPRAARPDDRRGFIVGGLVAAREARRRGLDTETLK